jgi:hypothetical protein
MRTDGQAGRQSDMTKLLVTFLNFGNTPNTDDDDDDDDDDTKERWYDEDSEKKAKDILAECCGLQRSDDKVLS